MTGAAPFLAARQQFQRDTCKTAASCILLKLTGGPSQLDTWDPKPDAPSEIRGHYKPIRTNVPGIEISEIFPRMAKIADKYLLIRSVWHNGPAHHDANTGTPVRTGKRIDWTQLNEESARVRMSYGKNRFGQSCLLARRLVEQGEPLVTVNMFETVFNEFTWDVHGWGPFGPLSTYRDTVAPIFDGAYTALIDDLSQRGLLGNTLVVAMGEFGRTPRINPDGGRDHWPGCYTVVMAGGGIRGGEVYGSSDRIGAEPKDNPVNRAEVFAMIGQTIG
jgi:hypothetical protein